MAIRRILIEVDDEKVLAMDQAMGGVEELTGLNMYILPKAHRMQEPLRIGSTDCDGNNVYPETWQEFLGYSGIKIISDEEV